MEYYISHVYISIYRDTIVADRIFGGTCSFNLLKMPPYNSSEELQQRLLTALHYGSKGFEFA